MIILDGGMGQELVKRAGKATDLWSMQALIDAPEMVQAVHTEFFEAGADIATTNTYAIFPERLAGKGLEDHAETLTQTACRLAVNARDAHGAGHVAGSLGPQGFSYQPNQCPPLEQAAEIYTKMARYQAEYVDFYILETMSSIAQATGGLIGAGIIGKPVWLALSVDDEDGTLLRSGEPLTDIFPILEAYKPQAVMLNCSRPEAISQGLGLLGGGGYLVGAYANGFTKIHPDFNSVLATVDLLAARKDLTPKAYLEFAKTWETLDADIIGGCCEIGPAHIQRLATHFNG